MRTVIVIGIALLCNLSAFAQTGDAALLLSPRNSDVKAFLPVYGRYVRAVREQGAQGLKGMITPDFTLRWEKQSLTGQKALAEIDKYVSGLKDGEFAVKVRQLTIKGNTAVAMTQETATFRLDSSARGSATWYWKQTWRKTPQGWKLAVSEKGAEKLKESGVAVIFTSRPEMQSPRK